MRQTFNFPNKLGLFLSVALPAVALSLISPSNDTTEKRSRSYQTPQSGPEQLASDKKEQLMTLNVLLSLSCSHSAAVVPAVQRNPIIFQQLDIGELKLEQEVIGLLHNSDPI